MKILIVDDEQVQRELLKGFLEKQGHEVICAENGQRALEIFGREPIGVVLLDHKMPGMTGDQVLAEMKKINPEAKAIMITAYGDVATAVSAMKLGAIDFLEKPIDLEELLAKIEKTEQETFIEEDVKQIKELVADTSLPINIIAESRQMKEVISLARRVANTPWPVLIKGETGTGKELLAKLIHQLSPRKDAPFIEVNCAAVPENLFESELFGHEKGAFTGALNQRRGRFELANKGTIFLDEIGELPLNLQPKLLRTLQENKISRVGSEKDIKIDVRIIAATNRDLKAMALEGTFREDLFYRLNVFEIEIPPLRSRKEDLIPLLKFFLNKYSSSHKTLSDEARNLLIKYPFPGNVRELEHIVQRMVTLARGRIIKSSDLPPEIRHHQITTTGTLEERLKAVEKEMILNALEKNGWIQTRAANDLGISERVLRYKMDKHGIKRSRSVD